MNSGVVLATHGLVSGYEPDLPIVCGIDLAVQAGEFLAVLGPNGAGKSTLVKTIAGLVPVHSGTVFLDGANVTASPAHQKIRHGLAFVPQTENIFTTLSIHENLQLAASILPKDRRRSRLARALVVEPSVLILDEPSAGLSPKIVAEVFARLRAISQGGVTTILVEQNVKAALAIADRAIILVEGRIAHEGAAATMAEDPILGELYLGARHSQHAGAA